MPKPGLYVQCEIANEDFFLCDSSVSPSGFDSFVEEVRDDVIQRPLGRRSEPRLESQSVV